VSNKKEKLNASLIESQEPNINPLSDLQVKNPYLSSFGNHSKKESEVGKKVNFNARFTFGDAPG